MIGMQRLIRRIKKVKDLKGAIKLFRVGIVFIKDEFVVFLRSILVRIRIILACLSRESKLAGKKVCIIYRWHPNCGIFSHIATTLSALDYADKHGYIPIFDTRDVPHVYKPDNVKDWWELYYEPPGHFNMDDFCFRDIAKIVDADRIYARSSISVDNNMEFLTNEKQLEALRRIYRKYIRLNEKTEYYIEEAWKKMTKDANDCVLGVRCRASAYRIVHPKGLSSFEDEDLIVFVKDILENNKQFKKLFLATDDLDTISAFKKHFDEDMLFYLQEDDRITLDDVDKHIESMGDWVAQIGAFNEKTQDRYLHSLNYITEIMLLTKCKGIVSNKCSASMILPLIKDDWEYEKYM